MVEYCEHQKLPVKYFRAIDPDITDHTYLYIYRVGTAATDKTVSWCEQEDSSAESRSE